MCIYTYIYRYMPIHRRASIGYVQHINTYIYIHVYIHTCVCTHIYAAVCLSVGGHLSGTYVREREERVAHRRRREPLVPDERELVARPCEGVLRVLTHGVLRVLTHGGAPSTHARRCSEHSQGCTARKLVARPCRCFARLRVRARACDVSSSVSVRMCACVCVCARVHLCEIERENIARACAHPPCSRRPVSRAWCLRAHPTRPARARPLRVL